MFVGGVTIKKKRQQKKDVDDYNNYFELDNPSYEITQDLCVSNSNKRQKWERSIYSTRKAINQNKSWAARDF